MQFAKDSFFLALQARLAGLNPARTVTLNGTTVPAVIVAENLPPSSAEEQPNTFYIEWGSSEIVPVNSGNGVLSSLDAVISYYTTGSVASMVDRGRVMGQLDEELLSICQPANTEKMDYTQSPSVDLGSRVFWSQPSFTDGTKAQVEDDAERHQDARLERKARITIYFFPEVTLS